MLWLYQKNYNDFELLTFSLSQITHAVQMSNKVMYLKFCVHLAYKGNQYEFRKHPKFEWFDGATLCKQHHNK